MNSVTLYPSVYTVLSRYYEHKPSELGWTWIHDTVVSIELLVHKNIYITISGVHINIKDYARKPLRI